MSRAFFDAWYERRLFTRTAVPGAGSGDETDAGRGGESGAGSESDVGRETENACMTVETVNACRTCATESVGVGSVTGGRCGSVGR